MIATTTPGIEGRRIVEYKGIVRGSAIHGINIGKDFMAMGRNLVGGRSKAYENELERGQVEAMTEMEAAAADLGANAVVGVTMDVESLCQGNMLMVSATGTAVVIE